MVMVLHCIALTYRLRSLGLSFETMFEEIPVVIRNSNLMNVTLSEIESKMTSDHPQYNNLDIGSG